MDRARFPGLAFIQLTNARPICPGETKRRDVRCCCALRSLRGESAIKYKKSVRCLSSPEVARVNLMARLARHQFMIKGRVHLFCRLIPGKRAAINVARLVTSARVYYSVSIFSAPRRSGPAFLGPLIFSAVNSRRVRSLYRRFVDTPASPWPRAPAALICIA